MMNSGQQMMKPAIHPGVDGMPTPEPGRSSSPRVTMLGDVHDGIEHVQVRDAHVAALHRQQRRNAFVLSFAQFHP